MNKKVKKSLVAAIVAMIMMGSGSALAGGLLDVAFPRADFLPAPDGQIINNPYWPLNPDDMSRTFTYIGETEDECVIDQISVNDNFYGGTHTLLGVMPYTGLVALQVVDTEWVFELEYLEEEEEECGVDLLVGLDAEVVDAALGEKTLDWYLEDDQDNIWYMGEYSQSFDDPGCDIPFDPTGGSVPDHCKGGSWEAGVVHELDPGGPPGIAGIVVPGDEPVAGEPLTNGTYYMQEVAFEAEDMAKILRQHVALSVEDEDYDNCRKVKEWNPFEHGGSVEHKWYCADGDGLVLIEGIGGGPTEQEVLVDVDPFLP